jgi:hypothetical protein
MDIFSFLLDFTPQRGLLGHKVTLSPFEELPDFSKVAAPFYVPIRKPYF